MPKRRQPRAIWAITRRAILARDSWACVRCRTPLTEATAHIDHIQSGKRGTNAHANLRSLCRRCHVLRLDYRHRGMIAQALRDDIIPADWRTLTWDDPLN